MVMYSIPAFLSGVMQSPLPVAGAAAIGAATRVYESKPVRDILLKIPRTTPNSAEEAKLIKRLMATMQTMEKQNEQD
jgi:hypothetical protein